MQFTMGTLTALFTVAMLGCAFAMMFADYQNQMLEQKFPFDVQVFSEKEDEDFAKELEAIMMGRISIFDPSKRNK